MTAQRVLLALPVGVFAASVVLLFWRVPRRLGPRLDPYTVGQRVRLGERAAELEVLLPPPPASAFARLFGPMLRSVEDRVSRFLGHRDEAATARALEHAGLDDVTPRQFRDQQFAFAMGGVLLGVVAGVLSGPRTGLLIAAFAVPIGFMRKRNALERLITLRRERMRAELWQVNGLLAVKLHASLNVQAVIAEFVAEAHGEIADELRRVLIAIETGTAGERALRDQAERTAEPFAARLYPGPGRRHREGGQHLPCPPRPGGGHPSRPPRRPPPRGHRAHRGHGGAVGAHGRRHAAADRRSRRRPPVPHHLKLNN